MLKSRSNKVIGDLVSVQNIILINGQKGDKTTKTKVVIGNKL